MPFPFSDMTRAAPLLRGASRRRFDHTCQQGSAIIYVFVAIGLLAALTYSFVKDSGQSVVAQSAHRTSEDLYIQASTIRAAIVECAVQYPNGGGDMDGDGDIDSTDNPNNPYPVLPTYANNPHGVAADNTVRNLSCTGAPAAEANIFQGTNNKGRFLPPATSGFGEWVYGNDAEARRLVIAGQVGGVNDEVHVRKLLGAAPEAHGVVHHVDAGAALLHFVGLQHLHELGADGVALEGEGHAGKGGIFLEALPMFFKCKRFAGKNAQGREESPTVQQSGLAGGKANLFDGDELVVAENDAVDHSDLPGPPYSTSTAASTPPHHSGKMAQGTKKFPVTRPNILAKSNGVSKT